MQKRSVVNGVLMIGLAGIVTAPLVSSRPSHVEIAGRVYDAAGQAPVAGAIVSNDWDSTTSTTNAQGEFRMRVRRVAADEWIKFSARSAERVACHRRVGPLTSTGVAVEIVLNRPFYELGHCH